MAKRLFRSCRSASAAAAVTPTTTLLAQHHPHVVPPPTGACCPRRLHHRRRRLEPCPAAVAVLEDIPCARGAPSYRWLKSSHWHVIEAATATDGVDTPRRKIDTQRQRRSRSRRRCLRTANPSGSSGDSGWFSSDEESYAYSAGGAGSGEAETLVASTTTESSSGASGNGAGEVAVAGSFAVVKRSDDPRGDFRRSMAEMVVGRGIYDADGLERLLRCFLALNDRRHRRDIVSAFGDVWDAVFSGHACHGTAASVSATLSR